jgi:hypothetical protein
MLRGGIVSNDTGVGGMIRAFRKIISEIKMKNKSLAFIGSPSLCLPFAELQAYGVKDAGFDMCFIPNASKEKARQLKFDEGYGFQLGDKVSTGKFGAVVILGGLAMPNSPIKAEDINKLLSELLDVDGKVIGVCFMEIFGRVGWDKEVKFDYIIDTAMDPVRALKTA